MRIAICAICNNVIENTGLGNASICSAECRKANDRNRKNRNNAKKRAEKAARQAELDKVNEIGQALAAN